MNLSASEYVYQPSINSCPLRDVFVALSFVTAGILMKAREVLQRPMLLVEILLLVMVEKFIVWTGAVKLFGDSWQTFTLVGTGPTQIGEFSFILVRSLTLTPSSATSSTTPPCQCRWSQP